jgi:hypothetical protein
MGVKGHDDTGCVETECDGGSTGSGRLRPSNGKAYHPCGLNHGTVDAINCFNVVAVSEAMYQVGPNLIKIYSAINTRHCSIRDEVLLGLLQPSSRHVVSSSRLTRMSQKKIVGQGMMDGSTTTGRYSCSVEGNTGWLEERSACLVGKVGSICTIDVGESWASGHVDIVDPGSIDSRDNSWRYKGARRIIAHYKMEVQVGGPWILGENPTRIL